eukprot:CAMPEP_0181291934 /NCGR_PEP_ID=MMETSP1101-20121128/2235_1 /TAXON_ID=46948 /ORGANISM="Rhodomonas abbreviata, Strain Caron Lab Isolate" /LENGTH=396 /DNA_ID=CAMNT_0023396365 /DNA_START=174 /DNA_END=1360 /DNA_ORIENTATION=-
MTRNAGEALDEQQLALSDKCEQMLQSKEWNTADTKTIGGLVTRLKLFKEYGLPSMRVVSHDTLARLGRIPRSNEGFQEDALAAVESCGASVTGAPKAGLTFLSHRWKRPNWCEEMEQDVEWGSPAREEAKQRGHSVGDPDDAAHSKARDVIQHGRWFKRRMEAHEYTPRKDLRKYFGAAVSIHPRMYYWIDWACTDQDYPGPDMAALPAYVGACSLMIAVRSPGYDERAWCRVELLMGYAFSFTGNRVLELPEGFEDSDQKGVEESKMVVPDPEEGQLSNPSDMAVVRSLRDVAQRSTTFKCWRNFCNYCSCNYGWQRWTAMNVIACGQCCCRIPLAERRNVKAGKSTLKLLKPAGSSPDDEVPGQTIMEPRSPPLHSPLPPLAPSPISFSPLPSP